MLIGVNFDGMIVRVQADLSSPIRDVVTDALAVIFPPGSLPSLKGCVTTLAGEVVDYDKSVRDLDLIEGGELQTTFSSFSPTS